MQWIGAVPSRILNFFRDESVVVFTVDAHRDVVETLTARPAKHGPAKRGQSKHYQVTNCRVIVPNAWVEWASIAWLGPQLKPDERIALMVQRLHALYGPSTDRHIAASSPRFGCAQWVAAISRPRLHGIQALLKAQGFKRIGVVPAHAAAWSAYLQQKRLNHISAGPPDTGPNQHSDHLFATVDGDTLTVSWKRFSATAQDGRGAWIGPAMGIRNIGLSNFAGSLGNDGFGHGADNANAQGEVDRSSDQDGVSADEVLMVGTFSEVVRCVQREAILQRVLHPHITVVVRTAALIGNGSAKSLGQAAKRFPHGWEVFKTHDWSALSPFGLDVDSAVKAQHRARPWGVNRALGEYFAKKLWLADFDVDLSKSVADGLVQPPWYRWAFAAALLCCVAAGLVYQKQLDLIAQAQEFNDRQTSVRDEKARRLGDVVQSAADKAQRARLLQAAKSLSMPWESLFECVEASMNPDVTLTQIKPDAQALELVIAGDARTFKAIGAMVTSLEDNGQVRGATGAVNDPVASSTPYAPTAKVPAISAAASTPAPAPAPPTSPLVTPVSPAMPIANVKSTGGSDIGSEKKSINPAGVCRDIRRPYLSTYEINEQDPLRTLHFEIHADWLKSSVLAPVSAGKTQDPNLKGLVP